MINVVASITVAEGKRDDFIKVFKDLVPTVLQESGCIEYAPMIDAATGIEGQATDLNVVTILEKWESADALQAHLAAAHMDQFRQAAADMIQSLSIKILQPA